jgi:hypothetical protein
LAHLWCDVTFQHAFIAAAQDSRPLVALLSCSWLRRWASRPSSGIPAVSVPLTVSLRRLGAAAPALTTNFRNEWFGANAPKYRTVGLPGSGISAANRPVSSSAVNVTAWVPSRHGVFSVSS